MLQNPRITTFTVSELLRENQQGGGDKINPPPTTTTQIRANDISRVLQKLLKYFSETIISTSFEPFFPVGPVIFCLNLNEILLLLSAGK